MILGGYTFAWIPDEWTIPEEVRQVGEVKTYNSSVVFDFGVGIVGQMVDLSWKFMTAEQFDALDVIYIADVPVLWTPGRGDGMAYLVEFLSLTGDLLESIGYDEGCPYREKVKARFLILGSQVAAMS